MLLDKSLFLISLIDISFHKLVFAVTLEIAICVLRIKQIALERSSLTESSYHLSEKFPTNSFREVDGLLPLLLWHEEIPQ